MAMIFYISMGSCVSFDKECKVVKKKKRNLTAPELPEGALYAHSSFFGMKTTELYYAKRSLMA